VGAIRTLVVWCPDWPVVAAGHRAEALVAVVAGERVVAASAGARADGVRRGLRRREAQARCPELLVVAADPGREARAFEPVVAAIEDVVPGVEILRPGAVALDTRGPSRYFGGDHRLAHQVAEAVDAALTHRPGSPPCRVGVADGRFAAERAARMGPPGAPHVVPPGGSGTFLAPLPITVLPDQDLAGLLARLGLGTLGDLAALPPASVLARFGEEGVAAHRLARGLDDRPLALRSPPEDLTARIELDPPAERADVAAFAARSLAGELHQRLAVRGLACTQVEIEAETEHGERLARRWRHEGTLDSAAIAERVRWQLDAWLSDGGTSGGLTLLRLVPQEVVPEGGRQLGFWGRAAEDGGVARCLARVQGLLGPEAVVTAVLGGGRHPAEAATLIPWGDPRVAARPGPPVPPGAPPADAPSRRAPSRRRGRSEPPPPWPGRLPAPAPARTYAPPVPAEVRDAAGATVTVSGRGTVSAPPAEVSVGGGPWAVIRAWAGPWPVEERWWDGGRRCARFQVVTADGSALLLIREGGEWRVEAAYD